MEYYYSHGMLSDLGQKMLTDIQNSDNISIASYDNDIRSAVRVRT